MPAVQERKKRSAFGSLLHAAGAGFDSVVSADKRVRHHIASLPAFSGEEQKAYWLEQARMFDPRTREGKVNLLGMAMPGPKGGKGGLTRAELDAQVRSGQALGGAVKVTKMSPAAMAAAKAERESKAGHDTTDVIHQHGTEGIGFRNGQTGAENLLALAKHPGHSNTSFFQAGSDVFGRPLSPAMEKALMAGPEGTRAAYIVDQEGRITVGGPGTHHDQLMAHKGITDPKTVIQGEIHFEQPLYDRPIPARLYTGRSVPLGGLAKRLGRDMDPGFQETFGPAKPNHVQTAAIEDWMNKANGVGSYVSIKGHPTTPRSKLSVGRDPTEAVQVARARQLRRKLAGEPNPLGKASPSALQIAGRANPNARNEASRLAGGPLRPKNHESQRVNLGVQEGGMGHGATAVPAANPKVLVPSRTTRPDAERHIPMGPRPVKKPIDIRKERLR